jgi:hypothetical protein
VLTPFQEKTEAALRAALARVNVSLENRLLEGERETFVRVRLSGTSLEVFIYEDEAGVQGPGLDVRFEAPDYDSSDQLAKAFIAETVARAQQNQNGS